LGSAIWIRWPAWLANDVFPYIGGRPVAELTAPEFLRVARRIEERAIESAHRILQNCGQVMRYAIATGRAERNPVTDLRGSRLAHRAPPSCCYRADRLRLSCGPSTDTTAIQPRAPP
jgi:hypothetical protein